MRSFRPKTVVTSRLVSRDTGEEHVAFGVVRWVDEERKQVFVSFKDSAGVVEFDDVTPATEEELKDFLANYVMSR